MRRKKSSLKILYPHFVKLNNYAILHHIAEEKKNNNKRLNEMKKLTVI